MLMMSKPALSLLSLCLISSITNAEVSTPFLTHDQNPLVLIHGLPAPTPAALPGKSKPGKSNWVWAGSLNITNTLNNETNANERLTIDGEINRLELFVDYGLSNDWNLRINIPFISYRAGFLDNAIENYHDLLGLRQGDRTTTPQDRLLFSYRRNNEQRILIDNSQDGLGDISLMLSHQLQQSSNSAYSLWVSAEFASGDSDKLTGNGASDIAVWAAGQQQLNKKTGFYGTVGLLFPGNSEVLPELIADDVLFGSLGLDWQAWSKVAIKTQFEWHSSFYEDSNTELLGDAVLLSFGISWHLSDDLAFDIAVSEDIRVDSAPDVNFHFAIRQLY